MTTAAARGTRRVEQKMSKSLGNFVALDDPPQEMFGKLMSLSSDDDGIGDYARLCTDLSDDDVESDRRRRAGRWARCCPGQARDGTGESLRSITERRRPSRPRTHSTRSSVTT